MVTRSPLLFLLPLLAALVVVHAVEDVRPGTGDSSKGGSANRCIDMETCGQCVQAGGNCGWCRQDKYDADNKPRCNLVEHLVSNRCDPAFITHPESTLKFVKNKTTEHDDGSDSPIQLSPQEVNIKLRPNKPHTMSVRFRQAANYPVDLYYIMDLSNSMADDKVKLAELGNKLAARMSNITSNFKLGFGSFVDKRTMPYVSTLPAKLKSPCAGCVAPYGFKNQMKLTTNTARFKTEVLKADISGNLDTPEGGFDAIMQAVSCHSKIGWRVQSRKLLLVATDAPFHMAGDGKNEIGWRPQSRKMLLFSTDAGFHIAGDGKLGGIVTPNDGQCHVDKDGYYSESLNQDYPSISQLANKITQQKVNVIFAVTAAQKDMYERLSQFIEGSEVGTLKSDSANIVELVQDNYNKISSVVELKPSGNDDIDVTFRTTCNGTEERDNATCHGVKTGEHVDYAVRINVKECPKDRKDWNKTFTIYPVGLTEKLTINLQLICECECEDVSVAEPYSEKCNKSGTFECGACTCDPGRYGKNCECDGSDSSSEDYEAACRPTNTSEVCSGNGQCLCGSCDCNPTTPGDPSKRYSGRYCECDDYSCDYHEGKSCGGPSKGKCECGECSCNIGYNGSACQCPISKEPCRAAPQEKGKEGLICNGKGECICGKCHCDRDTYYRGPTCEDCPTCPGKCEKNKACVQCRVFESGEFTQEYCTANCTHILIEDSLQVDEDTQRMCQFRDEDDCVFYFAYEYNSERVYAQRTKECPEPVNPVAISLAVIGAIVAIGIALLCIWKLFTTIHDRREFAKFEKERQNAKWDTGENPIYKGAVSTFRNPMYATKQ